MLGAGVCFLAGVVVAAVFFDSPGGKTQAQSPAGDTTSQTSSPTAATRREDPHAAARRLSKEDQNALLTRLLQPEGDWSDEDAKALMKQLLVDPAFANRLWHESPEDRRSAILVRLLSRLGTDCPSQTWPVIRALDFDLSGANRWPDIVEKLNACARGAPTAAYDFLRSHSAKDDEVARTIASCCAQGVASSRRLVEDYLSGQEGIVSVENLKLAFEQSLMKSGLILPDGWERLPGAESQIQSQTSREASARMHQWAIDGYSIDLFDSVPIAELADRASRENKDGKYPVNSAFLDEMVRRGQPDQVRQILDPLAERADASSIVRVLSGMSQLSQDKKDQVAGSMAFVVGGHAGADGLALAGLISDPKMRAASQARVLNDWIQKDPEAVRNYLPKIADEGLRQRVSKAVDFNLIPAPAADPSQRR